MHVNVGYFDAGLLFFDEAGNLLPFKRIPQDFHPCPQILDQRGNEWQWQAL
jgi:hypothetical protein